MPALHFTIPAGLSLMPHELSILGGASGIMASTVFPDGSTPSLYQARTDNPLGTPFYFYAGGRITNRLGVGVAVNTPYGNALTWANDWAGRFLVQEISLQAITIQPTISYKVGDFLSFGAGFVYALGNVDMTRALPFEGPEGEGSVNIQGSTANYGFNAGIMYSNEDGLNVGISYRSQIDMAVDDADARFSVPQSLQANFPPENRVAVTLPLPANLDFGVSYQVNRELMIGMALNYVFWSAYDTLSFNFATNTPTLQDSHNPREYRDRLIVRLGGQYRVNESLYLRAGGYYDPSPVNENYFSPETPSLDNIAFTAGLSFLPMENLSIDLSFLFIMGMEREVRYAPENFGGTYKSRAYIPGIGISYQF
jgi:long-chain fatty acid transport protein